MNASNAIAGGFDDIAALVGAEMGQVNDEIRLRLRSDVVLINQLGNYIVAGGGKRLRPHLVLLAAGAAGYRGRSHVAVAAIIEFIHTATLLHDDVVDDSKLRRGQESANVVWGNEAAVLVGDFLYSRAFEMMVDVGEMRVMEILARTTNVIAEGEVLQLLNVHDADTTEERYLEVITCKTAKLFEASARLGAVLAGVDTVVEQALAQYGMHLGLAFQLIDDVLDYSATSEVLGKNMGDDLAEGKPTLPLILALRSVGGTESGLLRRAIEQGQASDADIEQIAAIVSGCGALDQVRDQARVQAAAARDSLSRLPGNEYRHALDALATFAVERDH